MLKQIRKNPANSLLILTFLTLFSIMEAAGAEVQTLRFAYLGDTGQTTFDGVQQGLTEANLQGSFLGQNYALETFKTDAVAQLDPSRYIALIAAVNDKNFLLKLSKIAGDMPVFNVASGDDSLRRACLPNLLHVIPSHRMLQDAQAQWLKKQPGSHAEARAWDAGYLKFAARDLNKRFRKAFNKGMDDYAWAGWAAVLSAYLFRAYLCTIRVLNPGLTIVGPLSYMKTKLLFDGQKGIDMKFRETNQLIQPLLLIENGKILGEAPVRGVVDPDDYSSLGLLHCPK